MGIDTPLDKSSSIGSRHSKASGADHNPPVRRSLGIFFGGGSGGQTKGIETDDLEFLAAGGAGEDLAAIHVELGDLDGMPAGRAGGH